MEVEKGRYKEHRHTPPCPELESSHLFRDVLLEMTRDRSRAIDPKIDSIDLGQYQHLVTALWALTFKGRKKGKEQEEFAAYFYLSNTSIRLLPVLLRGDDRSIAAPILLDPFVEFEGMDKAGLPLGLLHTHPEVGYTFPSHEDLKYLFAPRELLGKDSTLDPFLFIGSISRNLKTIVFRGQNTPTLSQDQIYSYLQASDLLWRRKYYEFSLKRNESKPDVVGIGIRRFGMAPYQFTRTSIDFDLQIFQGEVDSPFLTRLNPRDIPLRYRDETPTTK